MSTLSMCGVVCSWGISEIPQRFPNRLDDIQTSDNESKRSQTVVTFCLYFFVCFWRSSMIACCSLIFASFSLIFASFSLIVASFSLIVASFSLMATLLSANWRLRIRFFDFSLLQSNSFMQCEKIAEIKKTLLSKNFVIMAK